jgi:predicted ATPase
MTTEQAGQIDAAEVLDWMRVPGRKGVYVLGCLARPLTFHSQQQRAFNLIWALFARGELAEGQTVAVVGGGLAGMTTAAAAVLQGCEVTLLEKREHLFHLQRLNSTRYIHPNILDWPRDGAYHPTTDLPCLNWHADYADHVVEQVDSQWEHICKDALLKVVLECNVGGIYCDDNGRPKVVSASGSSENRYHNKAYDCVILAVGFGLERDLSSIQCRSYWEGDSLHEPVRRGPIPRKFLVTGCGDGGLLDVLRLRIDNFKHDQLASGLLADEQLGPIKKQLISIDSKAYPLIGKCDIGTFLYDQYGKLKILPQVINKIVASLRKDTNVVLNGPTAYPFNLGASILNRFAIFLLFEHDQRLKYKPGEIKPKYITQTATGYRIAVEDVAYPWEEEFHEVIVRHGAHSALKSSFPTIAELCAAQPKLGEDPTRHRLYPKDFFRENKQWRVPIPKKGSDDKPAVTPHNLPRQWNFIGRQKESAEVKNRLSGTSLLTLIGAGGCGKTALALKVAGELLDVYPDGVWWVSLGPLSDPTLVPQAVAAVVGVREPRGGSLTETLVSVLKEKSILLILDNCEHLLRPCGELVHDLLRTCPRLKILATSRQSLHLTEIEHTYGVPPLSLPEQVPTLSDSEAVQLFVERARMVSNFELTDKNAQPVADVCRRLGGIPFAIVLAAARMRTLDVEDIAKELNDRFKFLTGGSEEALPHQRTLQATMDWSYNLLIEVEQKLLRRLVVFKGGWKREAAEAVCSGQGITKSKVLDLLDRLVDKSLVEAGPITGGSRRYYLLETTWEYCLKLPAPLKDRKARSERHRDYFLALVEESKPGPDKTVETSVLDRLDPELDNMRSALALKPATVDGVEKRLRLAGALRWFWERQGHLTEGRKWLEDSLVGAEEVSTAVRAEALHGAGSLAYRQGDFAAAHSFLQESLTLWTEGERWHRAHSLQSLGSVAREEGNCELAWDSHEEALQIMRCLKNKEGIAHALNGLGIVSADKDDYQTARLYFNEAIETARELEKQDLRAILLAAPLNNLGIIERNEGNYEKARQLHEESLQLCESLKSRGHIALVLYNLGIVFWHQGNPIEARDCHTKSMSIVKALGDKRGIALSLEGWARVWESQGQAERATWLFSAAQKLRDAINCPLEPNERRDYNRSLAAVRTSLGEEAFSVAWARGKMMTREQAINYALGE